jgi:hypothetical protein
MFPFASLVLEDIMNTSRRIELLEAAAEREFWDLAKAWIERVRGILNLDERQATYDFVRATMTNPDLKPGEIARTAIIKVTSDNEAQAMAAKLAPFIVASDGSIHEPVLRVLVGMDSYT